MINCFCHIYSVFHACCKPLTCHKSLNSLLCMDESRKIISLPIFLMICSIMIQAICAVTDAINSSQIMRDGETMISSGGVFELGFFSPGNSDNRYVGLWYKNITVITVVWVANRESPLRNKSGALKLTQQGLLVILDDTNGSIVWSSNKSSSSLSSWRSAEDPSPGIFTVHVDVTGYPQTIQEIIAILMGCVVRMEDVILGNLRYVSAWITDLCPKIQKLGSEVIGQVDVLGGQI